MRHDTPPTPILPAASGRVVRLPIQDRALDAAKRGVADPRTMTEDDIKLVCRTLIVHYAQMGIG